MTCSKSGPLSPPLVVVANTEVDPGWIGPYRRKSAAAGRPAASVTTNAGTISPATTTTAIAQETTHGHRRLRAGPGSGGAGGGGGGGGEGRRGARCSGATPSSTFPFLVPNDRNGRGML